MKLYRRILTLPIAKRVHHVDQLTDARRVQLECHSLIEHARAGPRIRICSPAARLP
jgi:hypothetical protein